MGPHLAEARHRARRKVASPERPIWLLSDPGVPRRPCGARVYTASIRLRFNCQTSDEPDIILAPWAPRFIRTLATDRK